MSFVIGYFVIRHLRPAGWNLPAGREIMHVPEGEPDPIDHRIDALPSIKTESYDMRIPFRLSVLALVLTGFLQSGAASAENEGLEDLDRATEIKLTFRTLSDLGEVIRLCQSALEKGLDEENAQFARQLLASTRIQRGSRYTELIVHKGGIRDPQWQNHRRVALEDLEKGVEFDPQNSQALFRITQLNLLPGGDRKRAAEALDAVIATAKDDLNLRIKALTLRATLAQDPKKKLGDLDEAIRANPKNAAPLRLRGMVHARLEQYDEALADFDAALALTPEDAREYAITLEERAEVLIELERYDEAIAGLEKVRQLAPEAVAPLIQQARVLGLQENYPKALEALNEAYKLQPADLRVLLVRASVYLELEELESALADVDQALKLSPGLSEAMRLRAALLDRMDRLDEAIAQFEEVLKANPDDLQLRLQLALYYSAKRRTRKAIETFSAVLEKHADNAIALRGRADALLGIGKQAEAVGDYEKALEQTPEDTGVLNNLAWVLATSPDEKLRDGLRAIELAKKACELTEYKQAHILSTLGASYAETGDFETAMEWSRKAIELAEKERQEAIDKAEAATDVDKEGLEALKKEATERVEALHKELESYRDGKPFRELLSEEAPDDEEDAEASAPEKQESDEPEEKPASEAEEEKPAEPQEEEPAKADEEPTEPAEPESSSPEPSQPESAAHASGGLSSTTR
jgi:tetratricopeptide (TPR) repeat protein